MSGLQGCDICGTLASCLHGKPSNLKSAFVVCARLSSLPSAIRPATVRRSVRAEGARREAWEEAGAKIEIEALLAVYDIPRISQVQIIYAARLATPDIAPGVESLETRLMDWAEIPWRDIAFPSVHWALHDHREYSSGAPYTVRGNPAADTAPDIRTL